MTGAVASESVTEARAWLAQRGRYSRLQSVTAQASLTARATARAGTKVGRSDPVVPRGRAIAQRIKGTLGITGLSRPRVHIDGAVWHLDVGLSHPGAGEGPKGPAVRRLKWHASWVQNVARQFGPLSSVGVGDLRGSIPSTRGPELTHLWCSSCSVKSIAGQLCAEEISAESI